MSRSPVETSVDEAMRRVRRAVAEQRAANQLASTDAAPSSQPGLERVQSALAMLDAPPTVARGGRLRRATLSAAARVARSALQRLQAPERDLDVAMATSLQELRQDIDRQKLDLQNLVDRANPRPTPRLGQVFSPLDLHRRFSDESEASKQRLSDYAAKFDGCKQVLDLGCGTGRFLLACHERGVPAVGVDHDPAMVEASQAAGVRAIQADALGYLGDLPDGSLDGIFSAQFIEHLDSGDLVQLISSARDKLRPNGRILIETLNPECLQVLYRWFWLDPTHQRLVHPWLLEQLLTTAGFSEIETHILPPSDGALRIPALQELVERNGRNDFDQATKYLNDLLYSGPDYFTVAQR